MGDDLSRYREEYDSFLLLVSRPWCWACGRDERQRFPEWYGPWCLHRAHIGCGGSFMLRKKDSRAVVVLCPVCHFLHRARDGVSVLCGVSLPHLTNESVLWLKRERHPERWQPEFLQWNMVQRMPEPVPPAPWFVREYESRRGRA